MRRLKNSREEQSFFFSLFSKFILGSKRSHIAYTN